MPTHKRNQYFLKFLFHFILLVFPIFIYCQDFTFTYTGPEIISVDQDCTAPLNWGHPNTPTVESNLPGGEVDSFYIFSISGGYMIDDPIPGGTTVDISYKAVDNMGNMDFFNFSIDFLDDTPPEFSATAADIEVQCSDNNIDALQTWYDNSGGATGMDNCGGTTIIPDPDWPTTVDLFNESMNSLCGNTGIVTVSFLLVDDEGNENPLPSIASFSTTDIIKPEVTVNPSPMAIECEASSQEQLINWLDNLGGAEAEDECSDFIIWTSFIWSDINGNSGSGVPGIGPYIDIDEGTCNWSVDVSFIVRDDCGNLNATVATTFEIFDMEAPLLINAPEDVTLSCDEVPGLEPLEVLDNCLGVFFSSLEETTTQSEDNNECGFYEYTINRSWFAQDSCGNAVMHSQQITVIDTIAPAYIPPSDITVDCRDLDNMEIVGSPQMVQDNCSVESSIDFTDQLDSSLCNGIITRTWTVSDFCGNVDTHVQSITVLDTIPPIILFEAEDAILSCDSMVNFEEGFQDWLSVAGMAQSTDECEEVFWFAAVPGSYDLTNPASFPGQEVGDLDAANCESESANIIRYEDVDFVFYDMCGNAVVTAARFSVIDPIGPEIINCPPSDTTILYTDSSMCEIQINVLPPFAIDNCSPNTTAVILNIEQQLSSSEPGNEEVVIDTVFLQFGPFDVNNTIPTSDVRLTITLINTDKDQESEFLTILGEEDYVVGQTPTGGDLCSDTSVIFLELTPEQVSEWMADSFIDFICIPNMEGGGGTSSINDVCGGSSLLAELSFNISEDQLLSYHFSLDAADPLEYNLFSDFDITLSQGLHVLEHRYMDCGENTVSCFQYFEVLDNEPPQISCPDDFTITVDDDQCGILTAFPVNYDYMDNCGSPETYSRTLPESSESSFLTFNFDADREEYIANNKVFIFNDVVANAFGENVEIKVTLKADGESSGEYFRILGDDGTVIGTTESGQTGQGTANCDEPGEFILTVPVEVFNIWAIDGQVVISAITNLSNQETINPCDPSSVNQNGDLDGISFINVNISYSQVVPSYYSEGATEIARTEFPFPAFIPVEYLNVGQTTVYFIFDDSSGNEDTCSFNINVLDETPPSLSCQPLLRFIHPSGLIPIQLTPADVLVDSSDNCGIDTLILEPSFFGCENIDQEIGITLTAIDYSGNATNCETTIRVESMVLQPEYSENICQGDTLFLYANAPEASVDTVYTYAWTGPNNFSSFLENPKIPNASAANNGTYTVTITGFNGCFASGTIDVFVEDLTAPVLTIEEDQICLGSELVLNANQYNDEVVYKWYEGIFPNGILLETTMNPQYIIQPTSGLHGYYVIVESENCSSSASFSDFVEVVEPVIALVDDPFISVCEGGSINLSTQVSGSSITYLWSGPDGFTSLLAQPEAIEDIGFENEGVYRLVIFNGPCSDTAFVEVVVFDKPDKPIITSEEIYCEGSTVVLSVNNIPNADQYIWQRNDVTFQIQNNNSLIIPNAQNDIEGNWTVVVKVGLCESDTSEIKIINIEEELTVFASNNGPSCEGDSVQLFSSFIPEGSYQWDGPENFSSALQNPLTIAKNGEYSVTISTQNGCEATASTVVEVNTAPFITALSSTVSPCMDGNSPVQFVPSVFPLGGDYSYSWMGPLGYESNDSVAVLQNFSSENNGEYSLVVFNDLCDSEPFTIDININDIPATPTIFAQPSYCMGDTIMIQTNDYNNNLASYVWDTPRGQKTTNQPELILNGVINTDAGHYSVKVVIDGCESMESLEFEIDIRDRPEQINISSNSPICNTDTLRLFADFVPDAVYEWRGPSLFTSNQQNPSIFPVDVTNSGMYSVRVSSEGCFSIWSLNEVVEILESPVAPQIEPFIGQVCLSDPNASMQLCLTEESLVDGALYSFYNAMNGALLGTSSERCIDIVDFSSFEVGLNIVDAVTQSGICRSLNGTSILVQMIEAPNELPDAGEDVILCDEEMIELEANGFPNILGTWTSISGGISFDNSANPNAIASNFKEGDNSLIWTLSFQSCVDFASDTMMIFKEILPSASQDMYTMGFDEVLEFDPTNNDILPLDYDINIISPPDWGEIEIVDPTLFSFNSGQEFEGTVSISYEVCSKICPELCDMTSIEIKIGNLSNCIVPTIITPNNDGYNDYFFIPCLNSDELPNNKLTIFNQWGDQVFEKAPYDNTWAGTYKGSQLPVGTYFFIFDPGDGSSPKNGFLIIEN